MNENIKKLIRTTQTNFPFLLDAKFALTRLYRNQFHIPYEVEFNALSFFPDLPNSLYLDVGGNRGQSTDAILMQTKNSRIQIFEPNPLLCDKLALQYRDNERVIINRFGLGDNTSEQFLYIPFYKKWMFDGLASFEEVEAKDWLKGRVFFYKQEDLTLRKELCNIKKLDDLNLDPFFIKLVIQGYEYYALKGSERTLQTSEPILLVALPDLNLINYLKAFGYQHYAFDNGQFTPGVKGNFYTFFMTRSKSDLLKSNIGPRH